MILWHYGLLKYLPNIELYYLQIFCQSILSGIVSLTSKVRKKGKEYAVSDIIAYRSLVLKELRFRGLPIWRLNFPWPYHRMGYPIIKDKNGNNIRGRLCQLRSNPMNANDYYLSPIRAVATKKFRYSKRINKSNGLISFPHLSDPKEYDNRYPNLLIGVFYPQGYLYQYGILLELFPDINDDRFFHDKVSDKVKILDQYRRMLAKDDFDKMPAVCLLNTLDQDVLKILRAVKYQNYKKYTVNFNGEIMV